MKRQFSLLLMGILLSLCLLPTYGRGQQEGQPGAKALEGEAPPFGRYPEPITATAVAGVRPPESSEVPADLTPENHSWIELVKEHLNIELKFLWTVPADQYDQKFNLAIAAGFYVELGRVLCEHQQALKEDRVRRLVALLENYIQEHLQEDLSLIRLSEVVYFNPSYLSRFYKQYTGRKLSDFIKETKMQRAKDLLATSQLPVQEIGKRLGFQSPSYFAAFFKKHSRLTPQEFRDSAARQKLSG